MNNDVRSLIIKESAKSLKTEGLKFSVDTLSAKLKISKKTVYKYFPTKQELAIAVYDYFYNDVNNRISGFISENIKDKVLFLLNIYFESSLMTHDEIFNKYALNDAVRSYAEGNRIKVWERVCSAAGLSDKTAESARIIVDGAFKELRNNAQASEKVIGFLVDCLF